MIFSGDFNGDGKADIVLGPNPTTAEWVVMTSTGTQFAAPATWVTWNNGGWFGHPSRVRILDIDGDGKSDILMGPNSNGAFHLLRSTGSGFAVCENFINTGLPGWDNDSAPNLVNVVDVTGDALPDLVLGPNSAGQFWVYKNMGGTATSATNCQGLNGFAATSTLVTGYGKWGSSDAQSMLVRTLDVNGDGRMDIVIGPDDSSATLGSFYVLLSRGDGTLDNRGAWFTASTYSAWSGSANRIRSLDMNGDGMADLLFGPDGSGNWFLLQSSGASFIDKGLITSGVAPAPWDQSVNQSRIRGFDVNGDGLQDIIIGPDASGHWYQLFGGSPTTSSSTSPDLLAGLHNGYGSSTSVTYTPSTHYNNTYLPFSVQVVSQVSINDGNGNTANTQYSYLGGYFYLPERDFRGFAVTNVTGPAWPSGARTQTSTYFHQGNDIAVGSNIPDVPVGYMKGKPWRVIAGDSVSSAYRVTDTSYTAYLGGPVYFDAPTDVLRTYCSSSGSCGRQTHVTSQYEATYGNLLRTDDYGDTAVSGDEMTTVTSYPPNASAWIVGLPASVVTYSGAGVSSPPTSSRIREVDYYYDSASSCAIASGNTTPTVGNLTRTVSVDGSSTPPESRRAFDAYGNAVCSRDANGNVTQFAYDSTLQTFLTATATPPTPNAPAGMTTSTTYYGIGGVPWSSSSADPGYYGLPQSTTTPNTSGPSGPDTTKYVYDVFGRTSSRTDPDGFVTSWGYSSLGTVGTQNVSESSPNGTAQSYFDGLGRTIKTRHHVSGTGRWIDTVKSYLATSAVYQSSAPYFESGGTALNTTYAYDVHGRPLSVTYPDGAVVSSCYDDLAGVTGATDPKGHRKRQTQDVRGRIIRTDEYTGSVGSCLTTQDAPYATTTYTHDLLGHVVAATNAVQSPITWDYDMLGRKIAASDPDLGNWSYSYDGVGNLIYQQDANGKGIFLTYDALNRIVLKHYCSGTALAVCASEPSNSSDVAYTYDDGAVSYYAKGRLTKMTDSSGSSSFAYDILGRTVSTTQSIDTSTFTTQPVFDAATRRLSGIIYPDTAGTRVSYTYDADGNLFQVSEPGTVHATLTNYNERGQVGTIAFGDSTTTAYTYDSNNGRMTHINTKNGAGSVLLDQVYGYDLAGNVLSVADGLNANNSRTYAYDELNRLTSSSSNSYQSSAALPLAGLTYGYDPVRVHVLNSTSDGRTFVHDRNGNRESDGVRSIHWSPDNLPVSLVASGTTISLAYDGKGRRVKKVAPSGSTLYSGSLYECNGGACVRHIFAGSLRIASISATGPSFVHSDRLGSTAIVSNTQGIQGSIAYMPFGQTLNDSTAGVVGHYKFNGQEYDSETGLYNYGARLYDPAIGRFVSADPVMVGIGAPQTFNRYSYALNNPMGYIDPSGHFPFVPILVGAAVGAIVGGIWAGVTGHNVLEGLAIGTVSGAALGTGNAFIEAYGIKSGAGMAAVYGATGAGSGALNAGVHHGNIAAGAIAGGALGVLGSTAPTYLPILDDGWPAAAQVSANRILTASASGAVLGGAEAAMSGGNIGEGARRGAEAGAMGGAFNLAVGLGVGFYSSGWRGPTSIDRRAGAIYFENALPDTKAYPGVSIGGIITAGPGQLGGAAYRAPGFTVRHHELAHAGLQLEALGPGYVPIHILSQLFGGHEYNLFERWFINVPDW